MLEIGLPIQAIEAKRRAMHRKLLKSTMQAKMERASTPRLHIRSHGLRRTPEELAFSPIAEVRVRGHARRRRQLRKLGIAGGR